MVSNWLFLAIIAGISSVLFNTLNRGTLKAGHDSTVYAWLFELIRFLFFALLIPFDHFLVCGPRTTLILISLGFSELVGVYLYMKMHASAELSISSILSRLRVLLIPFFAFIFLGERLSMAQYLGIVTIFVGCMTILGMKHVRSAKGIWYALGFVIVNTISTLLLKSASTIASTSIVTAAFSFPAAVLIPVIMRDSLTRIRFTTGPILKSTLLAAGFNIITMYTLVKAYALASAGQVNSVFQGVTALAVVVGILFFHEHDHKLLKILGAILTTIGIILLV
jgi:drug/metabolite transporter (DMT)-like permease